MTENKLENDTILGARDGQKCTLADPEHSAAYAGDGSVTDVAGYTNLALAYTDEESNSVVESHEPATGKIETDPIGEIATPATLGTDGFSFDYQDFQEAGTRNCAVAKIHPPKLDPSKASLLRPIANTKRVSKKNKSKRPAIWKTASPDEKLKASIRSAHARLGVTFNLNVSNKLEETLLASKDPARLLSTYINREMRNSFGCVLPYAFAFEFSPENRLHVHGVVILPDDNPTSRPILKKTLMRAGGKIPGRSASRQLTTRKIKDENGWAGYVLEEVRKTRRLLGTDKVTFISSKLRRISREDNLGRKLGGD